MITAYTRAVSPRLAECALTHLDRSPIDVARASEQHAAYEAALEGAGCRIVRLPDLPDDPDGVFVEDTAILLGGDAVVTRPGAPSRAGEVDSSAAKRGSRRIGSRNGSRLKISRPGSPTSTALSNAAKARSASPI